MTNAVVTFGSDPEFFLTDRGTGLPIPAVGLVGGTKDKPLMVGVFGLQEDNVMAEFTTPPAAALHTNMDNALHGVMVTVDHVRKTTGRLVGFWPSCAHEFSRAALEAAGPQAMQFGCSPDFDAYNMGARHTRVDPAALGTEVGAWRFAGGHIHVGYKDVCSMPEYVAALFCDVTLGLSLTLGGERQGMRRTLYGMAGRFRPTKYGVEYRTPSNSWLSRDELRDYMSAASHALVGIFTAPSDVQVRLFNEVPWNDVRNIINTENAREARGVLTWLSNTYRDIGFGRVV